MPPIKTLKEQQEEILLLMEYAVPDGRTEEAKNLLKHYQADRIALNVLAEFYRYLPEAEDDYIKKILHLDSRAGVYLLLVSCAANRYIYMADIENAVFLGNHLDGIWDKEVLEYFALTHEESIKRYKKHTSFQEYSPLDTADDRCRICSAAEGELHRLGCPVEICPWCGGQLTSCNCRFNKLHSDKLSNQKELKEFQERLEKRGRIPFEAAQQPGGMFEV